jgi:hypothetical protein
MHIRSEDNVLIYPKQDLLWLENRENNLLDLQKACAQNTGKSRRWYLSQMPEKIFCVAIKSLHGSKKKSQKKTLKI